MTLLCGGTLAACNPPAETQTGEGWNLLARIPSEVQEQTGQLVPDALEQWGEHGPFYWHDQTERHGADGPAFVWTDQPEANLTLEAGPRRDRTLSILAWCPPDEEEEASEGRVARVILNEADLGEITLGNAPRTHTLEAKAPAWITGDNLLKITLLDGELRTVETSADPPHQKVGLAVAGVSYDERHEVEVDPEKGDLTLTPSTSIVYDVEQLAPMTLHIAADASGRGELSVTFEKISLEAGEVASTDVASTIILSDQSVERLVPVPDIGESEVVRVRVQWDSEDDPDSSVSIARLSLKETGAPARTPVIFLSIDTLSARRMSLYGHVRETTPNIDAFAEDAVVFEHCVTNAPWTLPSYMSVMTGLYPMSHRLPYKEKGWQTLSLWERWYLADNRWTMAEMFRGLGFETGGFVDNTWIVDRHGFPQGFDEYDFSAGNIEMFDTDGGLRHTTRLAREWISDREDAPFFAFVHGFDVHAPYVAPAPYDGMYRADELYDTEQDARAGGRPNCYGIIPDYVAWSVVGDQGEIPPRMKTGPIESRYDEGIRDADAVVGEFFDWLKAEGLYDQAIIVVHADHGETMDDTPYYFGHGVLDEEVLHVPLIIRLPDGQHGGRRVAQTVQSVDLYPTLMDLAGVANKRDYLHGRSLRTLIEGGDLPDKPAYAESGLMEQGALFMDGHKLVRYDPSMEVGPEVLLTHPDLLVKNDLKHKGVQEHKEWILESVRRVRETGLTDALFKELTADSRFEFLRRLLKYGYSERKLLYDLDEDEDENYDLSVAKAELVEHLNTLLDFELERRTQAQDKARPPTKPVEVSEADREALRKLGYAE